MTAYDRIKEILYNYETAGLIKRDSVEVLSYLSEDVIGIGMGEQDFISSKQEIADIMLATNRKDDTATYTLDIQDIVIRMITDSTAGLCAKVYVKRCCQGKETVSGFMQSLTLVFCDGDWRICVLHASPIMLTDESVESYPLHFADKTLAKLKTDMQQDTLELINKSFSGGIFGTYIMENYPLYFANDTLIGQMGYTREEFDSIFSDNVTKIIYDEDRERVLGEVAVALENGQSEYELHFRVKTKSGGFFWIIEHARRTEDAHGVPVLLGVTTDVTEMIELQEKLKEQNHTILSSIQYASKIQRNLLPSETAFKSTFTDYSTLWSPKDIVGGDVYWLKNFSGGTVLCVCDCTGHGIPGALLTMLVVSILDTTINENNCRDTAQIMVELDNRISTVLNARDSRQAENESSITHIHDGCDLAVLFVGKDYSVAFSSSGIPVFVCDGSKVKRFKGQQLQIGDGSLSDKSTVNITVLPADPTHKFYVVSDGLFDQIGGEAALPFGYRTFSDIILKNHGEKQSVISEKLWEAFESYRGESLRRDDVVLVAFQP